MAATITFRPAAGVAAALDARVAERGVDRSALINAALVQYLGMGGDTPAVGTSARSGDESQSSRITKGSRPRRARKGESYEIRDGETPKAARARQGVPSPADTIEPECPHPKGAEKKLAFGVQCTECGKMIR